ncbi:hypothetical protein NBRC3257_0578 [Gluconobacter thailandicus NBRC 3257]|uniref:Transposase n=1 Tax=Gluconobacter thailandicus NBRC 3257 TaxID=1381097 RepID=A0ABQ0ITN4_GLUTH|nr:hypothetical protein NBRC3255_2490 [Gluconobacter thailandicus NBRC 3255]GAD25579.1 hypothetical protein NBRC3257_0578 [Gluconobacter thailandicus NBRC 3257]
MTFQLGARQNRAVDGAFSSDGLSRRKTIALKADQVRPYCGPEPFRQVIFLNHDR